jgi:hypothetical protein
MHQAEHESQTLLADVLAIAGDEMVKLLSDGNGCHERSA